jgi:hypothetical protein
MEKLFQIVFQLKNQFGVEFLFQLIMAKWVQTLILKIKMQDTIFRQERRMKTMVNRLRGTETDPLTIRQYN